jgi:hypothetical protein
MASHASTGSGRVCAQMWQKRAGWYCRCSGGQLGREAAIASDCLTRVLGLEDAATAMSAFSARVLC